MNHAVSTKFSQEELDLLEDKIEFDDDTGRFYVMDYEQLSLGQFIRRLEECITSDVWKKATVVTNMEGMHVGPVFYSYRGSYDELSLHCISSATIFTAEDLLDNAKAAVGKEFEGWKGGMYRMDEATPLWFSPIGEVSDVSVVDVHRSITQPHCIEINVMADSLPSYE